MNSKLKITLCVFTGFILAGFGVLYGLQISLQKKQDREITKLTEIATWIKKQNLKPGIYKELLPPGFNKITKIGADPVLIANKSDNGAVAILWKSQLDWHYNYHGYIYVDPKFPVQFVKDSYGQKTLDLDFDEDSPYVKKTISNQIYFVCHDTW